MAINPALLVSAAILQDYFVDNATGTAMANGVISLYEDKSRTTYKNWYYQTGVPGNYTYIPLPNPMTLSAVGTITDGNGNDVIPFYYPFSEIDNETSEAYYITAVNANGQLQWTRQNFPFSPNATPINQEVATLRNYIVNNVFWRNIGSMDVSVLDDVVIAPSQHDGYANFTDIRFIKNSLDATDTLTFSTFGAGNDPLKGDITPEYYLNLNCTGAGTETEKYIQIPLSLHIKTLENLSATITIQAQNVSGNENNQLVINLYQFLGTGGGAPITITLQTLVLNNNWTKYVIPFTFPSAAGLTLGAGGDDAWFLQVSYPVAQTCNINFTKPSLYLSDDIPTNDFDTYDDIETIINSPRTGDKRESLNNFAPYGWVPMTDGTIGNASSNANTRANIDTWPLFNLIWTLYSPYTMGTSNPISQMYNSSGSPVTYGGSAIADFGANNQLALTKSLGLAVLGTAHNQILNNFTVSGSSIIISNTSNFFTGMPIVFNSSGSLPSPLVVDTFYFVIVVNTTTLEIASTYANALNLINITLTTSGSGTLTVISSILGTVFGESLHTLTIPEMPAHTHVLGFSTASTNASAGSGVNANSLAAQSTLATGGNGAHNNIQPSVFYNIFMKL